MNGKLYKQMSKDQIKFTIQLPPWFDRKLRLWAFIKGTSRAALASNILQNRIEANREEIEKSLAEIAKDEDTTIEALTQEILKDE